MDRGRWLLRLRLATVFDASHSPTTTTVLLRNTEEGRRRPANIGIPIGCWIVWHACLTIAEEED